jgi:hypothetical protein
MDLAAPQPELMVRAATVRGKPRVAKAVQHVSEYGGKPGVVQPVTMEPSVGSKGGIGVVVHLSKTREKRITFYPSNRDNKPKIQNKPRRQQNVNLDSVLTDDDLAKLC